LGHEKKEKNPGRKTDCIDLKGPRRESLKADEAGDHRGDYSYE